MKNIKYLIIIATITSVISCTKKFLDVTPLNELSDATFWKTESDANLALTGCYVSWETWVNIIYLDGASDNGYDQFFTYELMSNGQYLPTTSSTTWMDGTAASWFSYSKIFGYNNFLTKVKAVQMDDSTKEEFEAEVRFLRAYNYFNKVMFYGDVPLVTEVLSPTTILPRTPVVQVEQFILNELDTVSKILPVQNNITSGGHVTSGAAYALKARLELYMGDYTAAMQDAQMVINMPCYQLYPSYRDLFLPGRRSTDEESILEIDYAKNNLNPYFIPQFMMPDGDGGWCGVSATKSLVDSYEMSNGKSIDDPSSGYDPGHPFANRDPRLAMTVIYPGSMWNGRYFDPLDNLLPDGTQNADFYENVNAARGGMPILKWDEPINLVNIQDYDDDVIVIRLAEMYLTYAEAAEETGMNTAIGLDLINKLRARVGMPGVPALTRDVVRYERRAELAYEGLRYFDIKRWNLGSTALNGPVLCSQLGSVNTTTGTVTWATGNIKVDTRVFDAGRNYLLPIPQSEIDISHWSQNAGY